MDAFIDDPQMGLELVQPLQLVDEYEMPSDELVNSWGKDGEQQAIRYMMDRAMKPGVNRAALAREAGMSASQWSMLYDGQRGIPVRRFELVTDAVKSFALLKYYTKRFYLVLKTQREWGVLMRELDEYKKVIEEKDEHLAEKDAYIAELEQRLSMYEDVPVEK